MAYPTAAAWGYFIRHHDDIRRIVKDMCTSPEFQVPNTRIVGQESGEEVTSCVMGVVQAARGSLPLKVKYTVEAFDESVRAQDSGKLNDIMNDAWLRAPENTGVYQIPGFTEMCNLLDFTVTGFVGDTGGDYSEEEDEPAF